MILNLRDFESSFENIFGKLNLGCVLHMSTRMLKICSLLNRKLGCFSSASHTRDGTGCSS